MIIAGSRVRYYEFIGSSEHKDYEVEAVFLGGTPSNRYPMAKLIGKAGFVSMECCRELEDKFCPNDCGGCSCHRMPPCAHCMEHVPEEV